MMKRIGGAVLAAMLMTAWGAGMAAAASITVCEDKNLRGRCLTLQHGVNDLRDWGISNSISSFRIDAGVWRICTGLNFSGECQRFASSVGNLNGTVFQDSISSLRPVRRGQGGGQGTEAAAIAIYSQPGYRGRSWVFSDDIPDLRLLGLNNQVSSIRVLGGRWQICARINYGGCVNITGNIPDLRGSGFNNVISSIREGGYAGGPVGPGPVQPQIIVYQDSGYRGRNRTIAGNIADLDDVGMNESISSVRVLGGVWEFCFNRGFRGGCITIARDVVNMQNLNANDAISSIRRLQ